MNVKQISVFLENKAGRLADVTKVIGDKGIDISALSIADTTNYGILRLIVNKPDEAEKILKECGYTVNITSVLAVAIDDVPGSLANILGILDTNNISVEYSYAFVGKKINKALVILKVEDSEAAINVLTENNVRLLRDEEVYGL